MGSVSQRAFATEGREKFLNFALYGRRSTMRWRESCVLSIAKLRIWFRIVECFVRKIFRFFLRMRRGRMKTCRLSYETPLLFSSSFPLFLKRHPFLRSSCRPLFPHLHLRTRERTCPWTSRTQRVRNSCLHLHPQFIDTVYFVRERNSFFSPSSVKEIRVKPSPANRCFIVSSVVWWRGEGKKTKNSGRARVGGEELGCRCTLEKGLLVVAGALQVSDEPQYNPSLVLELNWIILFVCLFRTSRRK